MSDLEDAINDFANRAASKLASLTPQAQKEAAEKQAELARLQSSDTQLSLFAGMIQARVDSLKALAGSRLPEIRKVGEGGGTAGSTGLRTTWTVTYALCPSGIYSGKDTLSLMGDPMRNTAEATMPGLPDQSMISPPITIGSSPF